MARLKIQTSKKTDLHRNSRKTAEIWKVAYYNAAVKQINNGSIHKGYRQESLVDDKRGNDIWFWRVSWVWLFDWDLI